jgi:hypothetical protein
MGTFDQLLVSPLGPFEIMMGKTIPAFILALSEATLFVIVAILIFRILFRGSLPLLYLSLIVFTLYDGNRKGNFPEGHARFRCVCQRPTYGNHRRLHTYHRHLAI